MIKMWKTIVLSCVLTLIFAFSFVLWAHSADITFEWDANTEPDLAGYKLHAGGATGVYNPDLTIDVGNVVTYTATGFSDGDWFFAATAYDKDGNESGYSNEVAVTIDTVAPGAPTAFRATIEASKVTVVPIE
ncbi:MAG: hypothetical protein GOV02_02255 [Candidatus Aenigmarchaeota archaeon]|nr:hypothetical protein [Candidatus Aenigmarchaeota archaeon]